MSTEPTVIKIQNVRLSFPSLFHPAKRRGADDPNKIPKYEATFILDKRTNAFDIVAIRRAIEHVLQTENKGGKLGSDRLCLRDGSAKPELDGYGDGVMFVAARSKNRPGVYNRDLTPLAEEDAVIYAGCYVNATIRLWWQNDKEFGKRVNCALRAVQFVKKGPPFGEAVVNPEEEFEALPENGTDDEGDSSLV